MGAEPDWDVGWRAAAAPAPGGWVAEIAVPRFVLSSYGDLDRVRLNAARNAVVPQLDQQAVVATEVREMSSWSRVARSFHEIHRFGRLRGVGDLGTSYELLCKAFLIGWQAPGYLGSDRDDNPYAETITVGFDDVPSP